MALWTPLGRSGDQNQLVTNNHNVSLILPFHRTDMTFFALDTETRSVIDPSAIIRSA